MISKDIIQDIEDLYDFLYNDNFNQMNYPQLGAAKLGFQSCKALGFDL